MRRILQPLMLILVIIGLIFSEMTIMADDAQFSYKSLDGNSEKIIITKYLGDDESVYIPEVIDGKTVAVIGNLSFEAKQNVKEIYFPKTIEEIRTNCFQACIACERYIVDSENPYYCSIDGVIYDKSGTKLCFCPENYQTETFVVKDDVKEIGQYAFRYHKIYYPKTIASAPKIKHIVFPEGLERIAGNAFEGSYIQEFILPDSLTDEGGNFLLSADQYKKLHIGANMGTKFTSGFNCYYLNEITVSPDNEALTVENNVLYNKDKTKLYCFPSGREERTYRIPNGVKTLASYSFKSTRLNSIDFNEVEIIESQTFGQDLSMKSLVFPKSVKSAKTIANFFQPGISSITILNPECEFSFPFNFGSGWVNYNVTIYGFNGSTAEEYVKNNKLTNLTLTFSALHTSAPEYDIYSGAHDYKGVVTEPTCTEQGYTHYTCSVCGIEYDDNYTDSLGHNFLPYAIIAPTCEEQGYTIYKCSRCEKTTHLNYIDPTGHSLTVVEKVEPTCTENGYTKYKCVLCKKTTEDSLTANGHSYTIAQKVDPTCTASGYTEYVCSVCGNSYSTGNVEPLGHKYSTKIIPATFDNNGTESVVCTQCNSVKTSKTIPKISQAKLKNNSFIYSGKKINGLNIIINDSNGNVISSNDYNLKIYSRSNGKEISNPIDIGQYKATVLFKNHYSGKKNLYFYYQHAER